MGERVTVRDELERINRRLDALTYLVACIGAAGNTSAGTLRLALLMAERLGYEPPSEGAMVDWVARNAVTELSNSCLQAAADTVPAPPPSSEPELENGTKVLDVPDAAPTERGS
jgi:hypothetical protein